MAGTSSDEGASPQGMLFTFGRSAESVISQPGPIFRLCLGQLPVSAPPQCGSNGRSDLTIGTVRQAKVIASTKITARP